MLSDLAMKKGTSMLGAQSVMSDLITLAQASLKDIVVRPRALQLCLDTIDCHLDNSGTLTYLVCVLQATGSTLINPPSIRAGQPIVDNSANITGHSSLLSIASSFINFNPCLVSLSPDGVQIVPSGVLVDPTGEPRSCLLHDG